MSGNCNVTVKTDIGTSPLAQYRNLEDCAAAAVDLISEKISLCGKTVIYSVGALLQTAKTLVKFPFMVMMMPVAFLLEEGEACLGNTSFFKGSVACLNDKFVKDYIMTLFLAHAMFSGDNFSLEDAYKNTSNILFGTDYDHQPSIQEMLTEYREEMGDRSAPIIKAVDSLLESKLSKTTICAVGSLFQAAKTLLRVPFVAVIAPVAFILEKVTEVSDGDALKKVVKKLNAFTEGFFKDLIMTIHLVDFTFSDKQYKNPNDDSLHDYSWGDVFKSAFEVVIGTEEYYQFSARSLWSSYIYGKAIPDAV